jgi:hypothetical protein
MVDIDLGEMFLNFPLHEVLQRFSGVDFSQFNADLEESLPGPLYTKWIHWTCCWMGPCLALSWQSGSITWPRSLQEEIGDTIRMG